MHVDLWGLFAVVDLFMDVNILVTALSQTLDPALREQAERVLQEVRFLYLMPTTAVESRM